MIEEINITIVPKTFGQIPKLTDSLSRACLDFDVDPNGDILVLNLRPDDAAQVCRIMESFVYEKKDFLNVWSTNPYLAIVEAKEAFNWSTIDQKDYYLAALRYHNEPARLANMIFGV